jgi:site-specific DNA-methyltransferase (cytosine-N4-specific)
MHLSFETNLGLSFHGKAEEIDQSSLFDPYRGNVDLIFTSPPFPLNRKKKYGNLEGSEYIKWLSSFGASFRDLLKPSGSIVIELGNSWEKGRPIMSTLALRALLAFLDESGFNLCQQFIWHNPAKLPSPAQWVNVERIRVKDSFTYIWWMSPSERPKANNRNILVEYSDSMKQLLKSQKYNAGKRPSEHQIGETSFLTNNNGAIPSNVLSYANTHANTDYLNHCRENNIQPHPARMPSEVAEFFVQFLTDEGDIVLDPFAGSNTTGSAAEKHNRRWIAVEADKQYVQGSLGRFCNQADLLKHPSE